MITNLTAAQQEAVDAVIDAITEHNNDLNWQLKILKVTTAIVSELQTNQS